MSLATAESIRDRVYTVIESLTPSSLAADRFRRYRNEGDFDEWAEKNIPGCFRRFRVREVGDDEPPLTSDTSTERVRLRLELRMAYPQTSRYGDANGMDRDDVMNQDWKKINAAIGLYGRGSFSGTSDCTPTGAVKTREAGGKVDYLTVAVEFEYEREV